MATVLIVEDTELNLKMARELLEANGFNILEAEDAESGIQIAREHKPDLILMDMYMPGKDGYKATQELKLDPVTRHIPVIAFSALAMPGEQQKAMDAGCSGFISKPINAREFAGTVALYLADFKIETPPMGTQAVKELFSPELREFLMKLSHDLQNPIRKVKQFSEILREDASNRLSAEDIQVLERIERSAEQMQAVLATAIAEFEAQTKQPR